MRRWILIANSTRARIYSLDEKERLQLVRTMQHTQSREKTHDLGSDAPGRYRGSMRNSPRSSMEPRTALHEVEIERFAHEVAQSVNNAHDEHEFDELAVVAPPRFLGQLRQTFKRPLLRCIDQFVASDCAHIPGARLKGHLRPKLTRWFAQAAKPVAV